MGSPRLEVFFVYNISTGAPLSGAAGDFAFETYKDDLGVAVTPEPTITEIGGGAYGFLPVFTDLNRGLVYVITTGASGNPVRVARFMRPEDWVAEDLGDDLSFLREFSEGKWEIKTSGPDANRLVIYAPDGTTVLKKFNLYDIDGLATTGDVFKRVPV